MQSFGTIFLVDGDFRRRASMSHYLAGAGVHVEPFEEVSEMLAHWPQSGTLLVHDDGLAINRLLAEMGTMGSWLPIVGYSNAPTTEMVVKAILDGAIDYISWPKETPEILEVLEQVAGKAKNFGSLKLKEAVARSQVARLTPRERQVLTGVANGCSNKVIGERLSISPRTVEIHRANLISKLGASHSSDAIRIAIEAALVS